MVTLPSRTIEYRSARGENRRFESEKKTPSRKGCSFADGRTRTDTWGEPRQILSLVRLPISPHRHILFSIFAFDMAKLVSQSYFSALPPKSRHIGIFGFQLSTAGNKSNLHIDSKINTKFNQENYAKMLKELFMFFSRSFL